MGMAWAVLALWMLVRSGTVMDAASVACRLFVTSVLPGLMPYMTAALMLVSRVRPPVSPVLLVVLGWGGGSPMGARLIRVSGLSRGTSRRTAVLCATMSPMFLLGTLGRWLGSSRAAVCILTGVLAGGSVGAACLHKREETSTPHTADAGIPLRFGEAVEQAARTMLLVCGTMVMMRVLAALVCEVAAPLPWLALPLMTLLEVTSGAQAIAALPFPLPLRAALLAMATGFGGAAILMQNRALYPTDLMTLPEQLLYQALHGACSFLVTLGLMSL